MNSSFLGDVSQGGYFLELRYSGASFDGRIEIGKLAEELTGLNVSFRLAVETLARHKRIPYPARDISIYAEPFEDGSFKERFKLIVKHLNDNAGAYTVAISVATLVITTIDLVQKEPVPTIIQMPPELMTKIGDVPTVELLKNKEYTRGLAAITGPICQDDDMLTIAAPNKMSTNVSKEGKLRFDLLAGKEKDPDVRVSQETVTGRITRVDLDAYTYNLGLKVDNVGTTVKCAFEDEIPQEELEHFIGKWVRATGTTTFHDNVRQKMDISDIQIIQPSRQQGLDLGTVH